jgi:glycosyltransferase involved in cell wall biosynthesis
MSNPFFSLVVPVFKTEAFLEQCLISIRDQVFTDFECLVVNDGSIGVNFEDFTKFQDSDFKYSLDISKVEKTKQVEFIFQQIVGNDSRFKLINKQNGGLSSARNMALDNATGLWFLMIDSDDWVAKNHLENFHNVIESYKGDKMSIARFIQNQFYNTGNKIAMYVPSKITLANTIHSNTFPSTTVAYNLSLVQKYKLRFDLKLGRGSNPKTRISDGGEDYLFAYQYLEIIEKEKGKNQFEIIEIPSQSYKYREIFTEQKKQEDLLGPYNYAKYFQQFGLRNSSLNVKIISLFFPFWAKLRFYRNPFAVILRKVFSLFFRLIS